MYVSRWWLSCLSGLCTQLSGGVRHQHGTHLSCWLAPEEAFVCTCHGVGSVAGSDLRTQPSGGAQLLHAVHLPSSTLPVGLWLLRRA